MSQERIDELSPCPFCGAGTFEIRANGRIWTGHRYSEPASVSVLHWCAPVAGQPARLIERVGRDEDSAITAWSMRAVSPDALKQINDLAQTYPLDAFPEVTPDEFQRAARVLAGEGLSLDRLSASSMRHVIARVDALLRVSP